MKEFKGKTAVITGAANGFGKEFARECAKRGMKLVLADIDGADQDKLAKELVDAGALATAVTADVSLYEEVQRVVKTAVDTYGTLDLMFNNAGVYYIGAIWDMPARDVQWMFDINVMSVYYGMREAIPVMMKQGTPCHIVNTASVAGLITNRSMAAYHGSKAAVVSASEAASYDLQAAAADIGISIFCPGYVQTDLNNCERHRPARYKADDPYYQSETYQKNVSRVDKFITGGEPIDVVVPNVFKAIEDNQFYVRTEATDKLFTPWMKKRFDNILNKDNPDINNMA